MSITNDDTDLLLWANLKIKTVEIFDDSSMTDEPLSVLQAADAETAAGLTTQDLATVKIINPSRVKITAFVADLDTLESLISSFNDLSITVSMSSKSVIVQYLVPVTLEIEQSSEMISASKIVINFEQSQPPQDDTFDPLQTGDQSSYGVRIQSPPSLTSSVTSLYNTVSTAFSTGVGLASNAANTITGLL